MEKISKITNQIYISNITAARRTELQQFERVITVCQDPIDDNISCNYEQYNLSDGPNDTTRGECSYSLFSQAANATVSAINKDETTLVHCHAGISRSPSVVIAALAVAHDSSFHKSRAFVKEQRPQTNPNQTLLNHAKTYIANQPSGTVAVAFNSTKSS